MNVPEILYGLNPKALAGGLLELWSVPLRRTQAAVQHIIDSPAVPTDRVVVLHHMFLYGTPGAGQLLKKAFLWDTDPAGIVSGFIWGGWSWSVALAAAAVGATDVIQLNPQLHYVLGPGHMAHLEVDWSAGANANATEGMLQGWMIPRGKIQLAGTVG